MSCWKIIENTAHFCPLCGANSRKPAEEKIAAKEQKKWELVKGTIIFYSIYLLSIIPLYWLDNKDQVNGMIIISFLDVPIVLGYWYFSRAKLKPLFHVTKSALKYMLLAVGIAALILAVNFIYHGLIRDLFGLKDTGNVPDIFTARGYGFGMIVWMVCIMPAVWEEIAFRGLILTNLSGAVSKREALIISSAMFAIIHVSVVSWPVLFLLGFAMGVVRIKSQSIWPAMIIHFLNNFVVAYTDHFKFLG